MLGFVLDNVYFFQGGVRVWRRVMKSVFALKAQAELFLMSVPSPPCNAGAEYSPNALYAYFQL